MDSSRRLHRALAVLLIAIAAGLAAIARTMVHDWSRADGPPPYGLIGGSLLALGAVASLVVAIAFIATGGRSNHR